MNRFLIGLGHVSRMLHRGPRTERQLSQLANAPDPDAHRLACGLRRAVDNAFPGAALEGFGRIEAIRERYMEGELDPEMSATLEEAQKWAGRGSNRSRWGRLLYAIVYEMEPETCVEFGGLIGISASYQALALEHNEKGHLTTMERQEPATEMIQAHFEELSLTDRAELLAGDFFDWLPKVKEMDPIDYVFIDGEHTIDQNFRLFHELLPVMDDGAVMVFDDITWSGEMKKVWQTLQRHPRVSVAVDLFNVGLLLLRDEPTAGEHELYKIAVP